MPLYISIIIVATVCGALHGQIKETKCAVFSIKYRECCMENKAVMSYSSNTYEA